MTPTAAEVNYKFTSQDPDLPEDAFHVYRFEGQETISKPYEFKIILASKHDFNPGKIMGYPAKFTIHDSHGHPRSFHGILRQFDETHEQHGFIFYRAILVPRIYLLTISTRLRVFVDVSLLDVFKKVLKEEGLAENVDFEFRLQRDYPKWDFISQYRDTTFAFISRWMEREGVYFYIEQAADREKIIFTDTSISHRDVLPNPAIEYLPPSGMVPANKDAISWRFNMRHSLTPDAMFMKDYNYEKPELSVEGNANPAERSRLRTQDFGLYIRTPSEGKQLTANQAQARDCLRTQFHGESSAPGFSPGAKFSLEKHYRQAWNKSYLLLHVAHKGQQIGWFCSKVGVKAPNEHHESEMMYHNTFTAIDAGQQFRMLLQTPKTLISGVIHGVIDAEGDGEYAELDDKGRYKVRLKFDLDSEHGSDKASAYLRMQQPYGGPAEGMHMPLRKGTEVSLVCTGGDPDRMEIAGVAPNPHCQTPVTSKNPTESVITTKSGNLIAMDDKQDQEGLVLKSSNANSYIRLGAPPAAAMAFSAATNKANTGEGPVYHYTAPPAGVLINTQQHATEKVGVDKNVDVGQNFQMTADEQNLRINMQKDKGIELSSSHDITITADKNRVDVTNGDEHKIVQGDNHNEYHQDVWYEHKKDVRTETHGNSKSVTHGSKYSYVGGLANTSIFTGLANTSISAAGFNNSVKVGNKCEVMLGLSESLKLAGAFNVDLTSSITLALGLMKTTMCFAITKAVLDFSPLSVKVAFGAVVSWETIKIGGQGIKADESLLHMLNNMIAIGEGGEEEADAGEAEGGFITKEMLGEDYWSYLEGGGFL